MEVPAYTASKHGLLGVTRALANEWTVHGIRVNGIAPGLDVDRADGRPARGFRSPRRTAGPDADRALGRADDLAGAVVYLASDASSYVSGSFIAVDGGYLAR